MEISSPVLVRSSNPTAANLIDNKTTSPGAVGTTPPGATGTNGRKKPAPLVVSTQFTETTSPVKTVGTTGNGAKIERNKHHCDSGLRLACRSLLCRDAQ